MVSTSLLGCGVGLRTGTGMSRSSKPVTLASRIGEPPRTADASLSSTFVELEGIVEYYRVRALFVLGAATGKARYRAIEPAAQPIFAEDENFIFRAGAGLAFAPIAIGPVRPVPYILYATNPETTENTVKHSLELGVDLEFELRLDEVALAVVVGAALLRDTGLSYADFMTNDNYTSEYETTGILINLGFQGLLRDR